MFIDEQDAEGEIFTRNPPELDPVAPYQAILGAYIIVSATPAFYSP